MKEEKLLISAHLDGEVESPWKEKMDERLARDPQWQAEAALHQRVKDQLAALPETDLSAAQKRVWEKVQGRISARKEGVKPAGSVWVFRPLLAAAAAVLVLVGTLSVGYLLGSRGTSGSSEMAEIKVQIPQNFDFKVEGEGQLVQMSNYQGPKP